MLERIVGPDMLKKYKEMSQRIGWEEAAIYAWENIRSNRQDRWVVVRNKDGQPVEVAYTNTSYKFRFNDKEYEIAYAEFSEWFGRQYETRIGFGEKYDEIYAGEIPDLAGEHESLEVLCGKQRLISTK